ncbi:MAG: phospho-sugar mutase [Bacteroidales bacterium]|nr:phospho-sugar mutase [Bacteroidales bacterium]
MDNKILSAANLWLSESYDEKTRKEVKNLIDKNDNDLVDSFYRNLGFGTGGLRGIIGVGTNRVNVYTVGIATQGFANYIKKSFPNEKISVAVIHDCRLRSRLFAETTANIFSANGFKVYLSESLRPTPELSFAIRHLDCKAGVNITASHNPCKYNGYKAYWSDGCQLVAPHDENVIKEVEKISDISEVKWEPVKENIILWSDLIDKPYREAVKSLSLSPEIIEKQKDLNIVFTPIHGTGIFVPNVLKDFGFENINIVSEQFEVNGEFPTLKKPGTEEVKEADYTETEWLKKLNSVTGSPNPEESSALKLAIEKGIKLNADIILGTDPDADRVGMVVKNSEGEFVILNGNQTGALFVNYIAKKWKEKGKLTGNEMIIKTIVTTELIKDIAEKYQIEMYDVLTGFKYIGEKIKELEGKKKFLCGGEESFGYLAGDFVRDKDAVIACAILAEAAACAKNENKNLYDTLIDLYIEFGYYKEDLFNITKEGKQGAEEIQTMMKNFRTNPPKELNGSKINKIIDYKTAKITDVATNKTTETGLPSSNVLQYFSEDGSKVTIRPSGTEPKIKFYFGVKEQLINKESFKIVDEKLSKKIEGLKKSLNLTA